MPESPVSQEHHPLAEGPPRGRLVYAQAHVAREQASAAVFTPAVLAMADRGHVRFPITRRLQYYGRDSTRALACRLDPMSASGSAAAPRPATRSMTCRSARCAGTGKTMRFTGTTILKVENGLITEEIGLDDGITVLQQLGLITTA